ncbi:cinA-like domain protein [Mycobacterium avium subsp. avium 2285 (R)]|nr:cinA-like domain protein [Mycobacterium avium subsp. avium 2285 (R)]
MERGVARHELLEDVRDLLFDLGVQHQLAAAETRHHFDRHIVGRGPQSAAGDDQIHALVGEEAQLGFDVVRAVAADGDVRQLDAELQKPIGDPGAVGVLDTAGEDLGSGDNDACACAHRHEPTDGCADAAEQPFRAAVSG